MAEVDEIIQMHGTDGEGNKYPTTLAEAILMEKDGTKTIVEEMSEIADKAAEAAKNSGSAIAPGDMEIFTASGAKTSVKLKMKGPGPITVTTNDNKLATLCQPGGFKVLRKTSGYPTGPDDTDATLVIDVKYADNEKYAETTYEDTGLAETTTYYYTAYPYSDSGKYNSTGSKVTVATHDYTCYGYRVVQDSTKNNNGVLSKMIQEIPSSSALYNIANTGFTPMAMNLSTGKMNYGSWTGNEFIFPKSCAVNSDTTVAYYINEDDNTKKADGSNITDQLNKMVEFGRDDKIIWERYVNNDDGSTDVYIADEQVDENFHAWPFMKSNGKYAKHFYLPKYDGYITGGKMLSISGYAPTVNTTAVTERTNCEANNTSGDDSWGMVTKSMWDLLGDILVLISMSTDTQTAFGYGYANNNSGSIQSGIMNTKGYFYGESGGKQGVKVMGIENPWGNIWRRIDGWNQGDTGHTLIKLCKGTADGSTAKNYSDNATGYIDINDNGQACSGYISKIKYDERGFRYPIVCSGSETTYYADYKWSSTNTLAFVGGGWNYGLRCGVFCVDLNCAASFSDSNHGSSPSCISKEEYAA